jgi:hypothetical protein
MAFNVFRRGLWYLMPLSKQYFSYVVVGYSRY